MDQTNTASLSWNKNARVKRGTWCPVSQPHSLQVRD